MFKKNKKSQAESQFHWVFVLIAGGIILLLFVTFVYRYKAISDKKFEVKFNQDLDLMMSIAEVSSKSLNNISDLPNKNLEFSCSGIGLTTFGKKAVFAPSLVKTTRLYIYSQPFFMPFKAANFVYIIDPNIRYVLINSNPNFDSIAKAAPQQAMLLNKYSLYPSPLASVNDVKRIALSDTIRFVFVDQTFQLGLINTDIKSYYANKKVSLLKIDPDSQKVTFYEQNKDGTLVEKGTSYYFDDASLFGAVIADKKEMYDCMMANAFERLSYVADIYTKKTEQLKSLGPGVCQTVYENFIADLDSLNQKSASFVVNADQFDFIDFNGLVGELSNMNQDIEYGTECLTIY